MLPALPPEVWVYILEHATNVPGTFEPDIYTSNHIGSHATLLRNALKTKRTLVCVCKQWWHFAIPFLYRSVYISSVCSLYSLSCILAHSPAESDTLVGTRPLGEYTERLDIAIPDDCDIPAFVANSLAVLIRCMPHLAIVSFDTSNDDFGNAVLDALEPSAASLRILDWPASHRSRFTSRIIHFLDKCTQLRILHYPHLAWSKELEHGGIPPSVITLHLHALIRAPQFLYIDAKRRHRPGPSALQKLILNLDRDIHYWEDLLRVYSSQLVSLQFYVTGDRLIDVSNLQSLARICPRLRCLTISSPYFPLDRPLFDFPSITYLGLRATRPWKKLGFGMLFEILEELRSSVPSLRVVQLLNEKHVRYLLQRYTELAVRGLQPSLDGVPFRVEDPKGVLLTDRLKARGHT